MAVVTRKFERKGKQSSYFQAWGQWLAGTLGVAAVAAVAVHVLHRFGVQAVASWDVIGWIIGFQG